MSGAAFQWHPGVGVNAELPGDELARLIHTLEEEMASASQDLRFEYAARLRDEIKDLRRELLAAAEVPSG